MKVAFTKMQALGNDFVIIDAIAQPFFIDPINSAFIRSTADRHLGVGCDQLLIINASPYADIAMSIYNHDASPATACGNGARCVAWLWMNKTHKNAVTMQVNERVLRAWKSEECNISLDMLRPTFDTVLSANIQERIPGTFVSFGNPHLVVENSSQDRNSVINDASRFFPDGVNIEWLAVIDEHHISIDIHERGVGPTKACGTGACAAAVIAISKGYCNSPMTVSMQGGSVRVDFDETVVLTGETSFVFEGKIDYSPACTIGSVK
jgi:diaminopimelate epimerase